MAGTTSPWADRRSFFGQQVQSEAYGVSTATAHDLIKAINGRNEKIATINAVRPAVVNNIAAQTLMNCINILRANINSFTRGLGPSKSYCFVAGIILCLVLEDINKLLKDDIQYTEVRIK